MRTIKYILIIGICLVMYNCGSDDKQDKNNSEETTTEVSYSSLPAINKISKEKLEEINKWKTFKELSTLMEKFQRQNSGDLTYFAEEFIRLDGEIEKDSLFPQKFNVPAVRSRLVVLTTFTEQFKTRLDENSPLDSINISRKRVLDAYNAVRLQLSETLKSKLYKEFLEGKDAE
ncbi:MULTISPECIES: hypothetical protein [Galbibacter]|uniref:Lipoprotein n=1 Tax=Galbibacter pacificus TaxID=2996052 RepID=A0ABT6FTD4_9FLAO|nr:hypothetical protein [Galbibacter pacificus]MDG3583035.1 hypothetical protein [Galbibacter pacificus]MDG3586516.1 hypothetical protein [Galbibacter pacificus]